MRKELVIKKCLKCGAMVRVIEDCKCNNCGIKCCGDQMKEIVPNSVDASAEKHIPTFEIKGGKIIVKVNHVMDEDHYIEWISLVSNNTENIVYFNPKDEAKAEFEEVKDGTIYAYCNKHMLWKKDI